MGKRGGLIERGAYFKFFLDKKGLIERGGLNERGLNGAFKVYELQLMHVLSRCHYLSKCCLNSSAQYSCRLIAN